MAPEVRTAVTLAVSNDKRIPGGFVRCCQYSVSSFGYRLQRCVHL